MLDRATLQRYADRFLPPGLARRLSRIAPTHGFSGDFRSWESARQASAGYDESSVLEKVRAAALKVKNGEAWAERDSVLLRAGDYPFPLLAALLRAALQRPGSLSVADFGGSLGSSYFQCRKFFPPSHRLEWSVIEQANYVECGRREFTTDELAFFTDIDACLAVRRPDVLLLSGVLSYIERPYELLESLIEKDFATIIVDRTAFYPAGANDRLTVQKAHPDIYDGSYPAWIFDRGRFLEVMGRRYDCFTEFDAIADWIFEAARAKPLGFIFERRR